MQSYFKGFLTGFLILGIIWFVYGRPDIKRIDKSFEQVNRDFKGVQQSLSTITTNSDGFTRDITEITKTSRRVENRSRTLEAGLTKTDGSVRFVIGEVDKLEGWNRQIIRLGRDLGEVSAELRRYNR